jgi:hypothetical protein
MFEILLPITVILTTMNDGMIDIYNYKCDIF